MNNTTDRMQVEVWSDVMCPFCYIGKRKFEHALAASSHANEIELVWKSFQLNPDIGANDSKDYLAYLQQKKGFSEHQTKGMLANVAQMANQVGLDFHFEKAIVANSFNAHRLSHLAKKYNLQNEMEEALFIAHFIEGKDINDKETLTTMAVSLGIDAAEVAHTMSSSAYADAVKTDQDEAQQIGVGGVPFFVFNRKYAISGAQDEKVFANTIEKAFAEWKKEKDNETLEVIDGKVCKPGGECE